NRRSHGRPTAGVLPTFPIGMAPRIYFSSTLRRIPKRKLPEKQPVTTRRNFLLTERCWRSSDRAKRFASWILIQRKSAALPADNWNDRRSVRTVHLRGRPTANG